MYRLSTTTDLSFLSGAELVQISVGRNEVILNFDRGSRLTILSDFAVSPVGGPPTRHTDPVQGIGALVDLLDDTVAAATATATGDLLVAFQSGRQLEVMDTSDQFESFWISDGLKQIIV